MWLVAAVTLLLLQLLRIAWTNKRMAELANVFFCLRSKTNCDGYFLAIGLGA